MLFFYLGLSCLILPCAELRIKKRVRIIEASRNGRRESQGGGLEKPSTVLRKE